VEESKRTLNVESSKEYKTVAKATTWHGYFQGIFQDFYALSLCRFP
jgi:hypothetical protein